MTIKECYALAGGNYSEVMERIGNETRIQKYLKKFSEDNSYSELLAALAEENWHGAFRSAHNLKGLCANLSLDRAAQAAGTVCEALRHGKPEADLTELCGELDAAYQKTLSAVNSFFAHQQTAGLELVKQEEQCFA